MNTNTTTINLVQYLYNETELTESVITQQAIDYDEEVYEEFQQLVFVKNLLDDATVAPYKATIDRIKSYSRMTKQPLLQ